ncbi:divalent-cation tolerance protein CutA [Sinirhodobacter sp. WL0062]|uniref:Divalent-cation tolerance protein CutA n=1 Tax=Rhodobacter flavimaris TaxID=2907145 RepID=A0ABS8YYW5_9RHOB|nr:divalent-cation tolerance protein CutA [Sinirhodobacter sp. WL0062]MCE5973758.1 divalent-cation tolerance protein CutA [Sinirhodobacter sp. WL0062]
MPTIARLLTYLPTADAAHPLAEALLDARLIACANIGAQVTSLYTWEGTREETPEVQLWLKTRRGLAPEVMAMIERLHPYDCPLVALDEITVNAAYADWVNAQTR